MKIDDAIHLIKGANFNKNQPGVWADLGCGKGVFTKALASILPDQSTIYAVDKTRQHLQQPTEKNIKIEFIQADFEKGESVLPPLDGVLMANSLHYVANKETFLHRLQPVFNGKGAFIIVEYDIMKANTWVPYPIDYKHLKELFFQVGFENITKLGERPSIYGRGNLYAASIF